MRAQGCQTRTLLIISAVCGVLFIGEASCQRSTYNNIELRPSCDSEIYCKGDLLERVQLSRVFPNDSKTFVDLKLKMPQEEVLRNYTALLQSVPNPDVSTLREFVNYHFEKGSELEVWSPPDFTKTPSITYRVTDPKYKKWTLDLNNIWKELGRKVKEDVKVNPQLYSILYTPNGFFIPGGRFLELYYWDTYWIVQGVLLCDMKQTAKGIIENILFLVKNIGFMPNGARVYYLERSQPPLLTLMVDSYVRFTGDKTFIKSNIDVLSLEFDYWMDRHMVTVEVGGQYYNVARFYAPSADPRPESFREDYELAEHLETKEEKNELYIELKTGAESGWDFSSRWFIPEDGSNKGNLSDIKATQVAAIDLNAILQLNAAKLADYHLILGNKELSQKYRKIAEELLEAIEKVFWNEEEGIWFDYDILNKRQRKYFYLSNFTPLWTKSYRRSGTQIAQKVLSYMKANGLLPADKNKLYGTPQSLENSGQQWDYPNAWAPSQGILLFGLDATGDRAAQNAAKFLSDVWLRTNYAGYEKHKAMFEKYNVLEQGETGGGGEYEAQTGFGWSNGLVFQLLNKYGRSLSYANKYSEAFELTSVKFNNNSAISEATKNKVILTHVRFIKAQRLRWRGYVERMSNYRMPKIVIEHQPEERRRVGRPKLRWININEDLQHMEVQDPINQITNRNTWRQTVKEARC